MKKIISIFILASMFLLSCQEDVLDKVPLDLITDAAVWNDKALIDTYLTEQYALTTVLMNENPDDGWYLSRSVGGPMIINQIGDEAIAGNVFNNNIYDWKSGKLTASNGNLLPWWERPYRVIRALNEFIEKVPNSPVDDAFRKSKTAEARWLRAVNYFAMVKRYGGVPLITKVQNLSDPKEELFPVRNPEKAIYDFVISEMDAIVNDMPETGYDRASKYAALALKCRAAMYAGSIAQYGTIQLNGLLGIPASESQAYYQKSYDAAKAVVTSGKFALYNKDANKTINFKNMWYKKKNGEQIFVVAHDASNTSTAIGYDFFQSPANSWGVSGAAKMDWPYLEMAEEFEYTDGTPGKLDRAAVQSKLWTMNELWGGRDPRFYATLYGNETPWQGGKVEFYNGLILPDGTTKKDGSYNGVLAMGKHTSTSKAWLTSFGVLKFLDESVDNMAGWDRSPTDWPTFRYAEILLNLAEVAFELNKPAEALDAVNQVRARSGMPAHTSIDREKIRHERKVELAFEGHRYWDLRRWRIAEQALSIAFSGINYYLDYTTMKYKVVVIEGLEARGRANAPALFRPHYYYLPITIARTGQNPNLVENPGY